MAKERHDLLDGLFHAVELVEGRVALDDFVGKDARQARVFGRVDEDRLADRHQQPLGSGCVGAGFIPAQIQILGKGQLFLLSGVKPLLIVLKYTHR